VASTTDLGKWMLTNGGEYNPETAYEQLTMVMYENSTYITLKTVQGITPTDDHVNYQLMAKGFNPTALASVQATDTSGVLGEAGGTVSAQDLVDWVVDQAANKLLKLTDLVSVQTNDATKGVSAALAYAMNQKIEQTNSNLFPNNGRIPDGTDFNSLLTVGKYFVISNDETQTMTNIPEKMAGRLFVLNMLGDDKVLNKGYQYFIQIYLLYTGTLWTRSLTREADDSPIVFNNWVKRW
jgi:hypothetical protein